MSEVKINSKFVTFCFYDKGEMYVYNTKSVPHIKLPFKLYLKPNVLVKHSFQLCGNYTLKIFFY